MIFLAWASGLMPDYRPTPADLAALSFGLHESERAPIAVPIVIRGR